MITYEALQTSRRQFLALTGLTLSEFQRLLAVFPQAYQRVYPANQTAAGQPRQRSVGAGYKEPLGSQFSQRREGICLPGTPRRAGAPARATALSDWLACLGLPRRCAGEPAVTNHKSVLQAGTTR